MTKEVSAVKPFLLIHIGTGKTGTTSIQRFFRGSRELFRRHNIHYLGMHFEWCDPPRLFEWQCEGKTHLFQQLDDQEAGSQLSTVLEDWFRNPSRSQCSIWSFEAIYSRPQVYIPALMDLLSKYELNLRVIAFVRNHNDFMSSAYKQWGVKHKTTSGPVLGFTMWAERSKGLLSYGRKLKIWDDSFGELFSLVNYDACADVVYAIIELMPELPGDFVRTQYEGRHYHSTPNDSLLALYALFNNLSADPVLPDEMQFLLDRYPRLKEYHPPLVHAESIFESVVDRDAVMIKQLLHFDEAMINGMLRDRGQPLLSSIGEDESKSIGSDYEITTTLLSMLLRIVCEQSKRIEKLESHLE